jgi:hypothetical protein
MEIELLASGNGEGWLYSGSGIFESGIPLASYFNPTTQFDEKLLIADVTTQAQAQAQAQSKNHTRNFKTNAAAGAFMASVAPAILPSTKSLRMNSTHPSPFHCPASSSPSSSSSPPSSSSSSSDSPLGRDHHHHHHHHHHRVRTPFPFLPTTTTTTTANGWGNTTQIPFVAEWTGTPKVIYATAGNFTCKAQVTIASASLQPANLTRPELFVLMAYNGEYDGEIDFYYEHFCALYRCIDATDCMSEYVEYSQTVFEQFSISMTLQTRDNKTTVYALTSTTGMQNFPTDVIRSGTTNHGIGWLESIVGFRDILLSASLLARTLLDQVQVQDLVG